MKLESKIIRLGDVNNRTDKNEDIYRSMKGMKYLFLVDNPTYNQAQRAAIEAISLDIRGDYNWFFERKDEQEIYEWIGELFQISINPKDQIVMIQYLYNDGENDALGPFVIPIDEWFEALLDWKELYLHNLGFWEFESEELSHFLGILIMVQDSLFLEKGYPLDDDIFKAIRKSSKRYGINPKVLYGDCRRVTGFHNLDDVCEWIGCLFLGIERQYDDFVKKHILSYDLNFASAVNEYLGINLNW